MIWGTAYSFLLWCLNWRQIRQFFGGLNAKNYSFETTRLEFLHNTEFKIRNKAIETGVILSVDTSGSWKFFEINKDPWFWHIWNMCYQFTKPFHEFEVLLGAAQWKQIPFPHQGQDQGRDQGPFFKKVFFMSGINKIK